MSSRPALLGWRDRGDGTPRSAPEPSWRDRLKCRPGSFLRGHGNHPADRIAPRAGPCRPGSLAMLPFYERANNLLGIAGLTERISARTQVQLSIDVEGSCSLLPFYRLGKRQDAPLEDSRR